MDQDRYQLCSSGTIYGASREGASSATWQDWKRGRAPVTIAYLLGAGLLFAHRISP